MPDLVPSWSLKDWYVTVPGSWSDGSVVLCSYFIFGLTHEVHCKGFGTIGWPV